MDKDRQKVMLVDDEVDFLEIMAEKIKSWGYEVIPISNPKNAVSIFEKRRPNVIIMDYIMPKIDGVSLLKKVRKIDSKVPAIVFTAYPDKKSISETDKLGKCVFIPKISAYTDTQLALKTALNMSRKNDT